ncbi:hypothetical protein VTH06DRAFT_6721 [Thermothelomyces fergusii]
MNIPSLSSPPYATDAVLGALPGSAANATTRPTNLDNTGVFRKQTGIDQPQRDVDARPMRPSLGLGTPGAHQGDDDISGLAVASQAPDLSERLYLSNQIMAAEPASFHETPRAFFATAATAATEVQVPGTQHWMPGTGPQAWWGPAAPGQQFITSPCLQM